MSVVVVTYDDQPHLDLILAALARQRHTIACSCPDRSQRPFADVVVADDGSPEPAVARGVPYPVEVVRQPDEGFRAAAARNLGAARTRGQLLLFLDGDTIPEPEYVCALATACRSVGAQDPVPGRARGLAVGHRRHADLDGASDDEVEAFLDEHGTTHSDRILAEPAWLADGYRATANLTRADDTSYRFVISAVLAVTRDLFDAIGGFDESAPGYGGEDWDLANRAWLAGADFVHEPAAVAWHDGPDAGVRGLDPAVKNAETLWLAERITQPGARDPALIWQVPDIAIELDDHGVPPGVLLLVCAALVRDSDAQIWLQEGVLLDGGRWPVLDPRVHRGPIPGEVAARCRFQVTVASLDAPVIGALRDRDLTTRELCAQGPGDHGGVVVTATRGTARGERLPTTGSGVGSAEGSAGRQPTKSTEEVAVEHVWAQAQVSATASS